MVAQLFTLPTPTSEEALIRACIRGHRRSQLLLYRQYKTVMFGICLRYAKDYHTAEDILQEGFVKVFRNLARYRHEGSFEGWLRRIFVHTAIEQFRRTQRERKFCELEAGLNEGADPDILSYLAQRDLVYFIQQLPDGYRTVFNLYVVEGYSHREIAELLGIRVGTSKSQLARAKATLKRLIERQSPTLVP